MTHTDDTCRSKALWLSAKNRPELREAASGTPKAGEARVRSLFGAISRGTEKLVAEGRVPEAEIDRMRAPFQEGEFPFPVKYGYAVVGIVEDGPEGWIDAPVFCLHPHQERFVAPIEMLRKIPAAVPSERAVLAANMETAVNIVWDAGILPGDRVAIVGGGVVGLLVGYLARSIFGTEVALVEIDQKRTPIAQALGLPLVLPGSAPSDCDVVIHASASDAGLATALGCAGFEARIVEASWYGERAVAVPLGGAFHSQRLSLVSSQVGQVSPARRARWSHARRLDFALSLLGDPALDALISGETAFAELPNAYVDILRHPETLCHRIRY